MHVTNTFTIDEILTHATNVSMSQFLIFFQEKLGHHTRLLASQDIWLSKLSSYLSIWSLKTQIQIKPCIFLGYRHVGYECLDSLTDKIYLSQHVIFDENTFLAKGEASALIPSKINALNDPLSFTISTLIPSSSQPIISSSNVTYESLVSILGFPHYKFSFAHAC